MPKKTSETEIVETMNMELSTPGTAEDTAVSMTENENSEIALGSAEEIVEKPDETVKTRLKHGGCIGSLERFIIICMLLLGQYSAVALVFTAKSIVRFKDFEDRSFAEYYLYGTLLSVAVSITLFALLKIFGA